jgi:uncharacterized protein
VAVRKLHPVHPAEPEISPEKQRRLAQEPIRARRRKLSPFLFVMTGWTVLSHASVALALSAAAQAVHLPWPSLIGAAIALALVLPFRRRMTSLILDRPRPAWRIRLIEAPYFAHWSAASMTMIVSAVAAILWVPARLVAGHAVFSVANAAAWAYAVGGVLAAWGVWVSPRWVRVRRVFVRVEGLDPAFQGYRIVQVSDLHIGSFTPEATTSRWVRMANGLKPDLIAVTGDLVSNGTAFHGQIADVMGALRAPDGVVFSPGNHDYFGDAYDLFDQLHLHRVRVLRNDSFALQRAGASLVIAGADDTWTRQADVRAALSKRVPGEPVVLLAHDPGLFPAAVKEGVQLVLSGHTHGGQVAVPLLARWLNLSRLSHRYHLGLYCEGSSNLYVNAGLGTTGPPIRLGSAPEITVLTLQAAQRA